MATTFTVSSNGNDAANDLLGIDSAFGDSRLQTDSPAIDPRQLTNSVLGDFTESSHIGAVDRQLGINLYEPSYYDNVTYFNDLTRQGSAWISFNPEVNVFDDGRAFSQDANGYPTALAPDQAVRSILYLEAEHFATGDYTLTWEGEGLLSVEVNGETFAFDDRNNAIAENRATIPVPTDSSSLTVFLNIEATDTANPLEDIHLYVPGTDETSSQFSEALRERLAPFSTIRFLDWNKTNFGAHSPDWEDRSQASWYTWGADVDDAFSVGTPYEVAIDLANELDTDAWITVPYQASDDYITELATLIQDRLEPELRVHIEYSNEAWNGIFPVFGELDRQAAAVRENEGLEDFYIYSAYGRNAANLFEIFEEVFIDDDRVVNVLSGQAGWSVPLEAALAEIERLGQIDLVEELAVAPYFPDYEFGAAIPAIEAALPGGITDAEYADIFALLEAEIEALFTGTSDAGQELAANRAVADRYGLPLVTYEAGQHITAWENEALLPVIEEINRRPEMAALYQAYLDGWEAFSGGTTATLYHLAGAWFGSEAFGHLEYIGQPLEEAPKYRALVDWLAADGPTLEPSPTPEPAPEPEVSLIANDDSFTTTADTPLAIEIAELLANDTGAPTEDLRLVGVDGFLNGVADAGGDPESTTLTFFPAAGFVGTASFEYRIEDSAGNSSLATVTVGVTSSSDESPTFPEPDTPDGDPGNPSNPDAPVPQPTPITDRPWYFGSSAADVLLVAELSDRGATVMGGGDDDLIDATGTTGRHKLFGGGGDDILDSSAATGRNRLLGGSGDDILLTGSDDRALGGAGDDIFQTPSGGGNTWVGGAGADLFVLVAEGNLPSAANAIVDFARGTDLLGIATETAVSFGELALTPTASGVIIGLNETPLAEIRGVETLTAADFRFF